MTKENIQCSLAGLGRRMALRAQGRRMFDGVRDVTEMTASQARGGRRRCRLGDGVGRRHRGLRNDVECTMS
jgi:hypothetical protein